MRKLSNKNRLSKALEVLAEQPSIKKICGLKELRNMRKILIVVTRSLIAEVVRDLHKKDDSLEQQSYSERQIYLTALNQTKQ